MLTSIKILKILRKVKWFGGVFPIGRLPIHVAIQRSYIINLDESHKEKSHWVAVCFYRIGKAIYFDLFGRPLEGHILIFIEKNAREGYEYSRGKYQGDYTISCRYFWCLIRFSCKKFEKVFPPIQSM